MEQPPREVSASAALAALAALAEPTRRRVYDVVVSERRGLTRDEVAHAVGLPRNTAAFHLDRLTAEGLLAVTFERRTGRVGPGAGRPSKVYARSSQTVSVSVPSRHYEIIADLLAAAVEECESSGAPVRAVLERRAWQYGHDLDVVGMEAALTAYGYEPFDEDGAIALANCPFHHLSTRHTDLVCSMNLRLLEGLLDRAGERSLQARPAPVPGRCCVRLEPADRDRD